MLDYAHVLIGVDMGAKKRVGAVLISKGVEVLPMYLSVLTYVYFIDVLNIKILVIGMHAHQVFTVPNFVSLLPLFE